VGGLARVLTRMIFQGIARRGSVSVAGGADARGHVPVWRMVFSMMVAVARAVSPMTWV
jgi:hypothetical protein